MPADTSMAGIESALRGFGANFDADILAATHALYRPHIEPLSAPCTPDVAYGPHERHRLDVYLPAGPARAVVVYVHGGGFVRGDKNLDGVFYANIGQFFAAAGLATVVPNYRRAGEAAWPAGAQDVQAVVQWVHAHPQRFGAGSLPVFVMGQSAGASHVASWCFDDTARGAARAPVAGVLLMSGFYRASAPLPDHIAAYFGRDESLYPARSPLTHVRADVTPLWLSVAELDPGRIAAHTFELAERLTRLNGRSPDFAWLRGHNHVSTVLSLGSVQTDVGELILRFLNACLAQTSSPATP
jgi:acetyl esterase/lipase